jgi:uncharacterized protein (DUF1919 family)
LATEELIREFDHLPFSKKVFLGRREYAIPSCIQLVISSNGEPVIDEWISFRKTVNVLGFMNRLLK